MLHYRLLLLLLSIPIVLYLVWLSVRHKDFSYLHQRLGFFTRPVQPHGIWIHAASVGEVNAVIPFLRRIIKHSPNETLTLSTNTPTGMQTAQKKLASNIQHYYLPIDWNSANIRLLDHLQPKCLIIMETELWPNLYSACHHRSIPIIIINGRLSQRTLNVKPWLRKVYKRCLNQTQKILTRSELDKEHFTQLGADPKHVSVIGNIKYSATDTSPVQAMDLGRPYILAASTRENEELCLSQTWLSLENNNYLFVIVPRHPHRLRTILQELKPLTCEIAVRSRGDSIKTTTKIYIADTFGELPTFIAGATLVFMGGSLVPKGGHNILEVAMLGKAVIFGPHMENFSDEAKTFLQVKAGIQIQDEQELAQSFTRLLNNPAETAQLGLNGKQLIEKNADIAQHYLDEIIRLNLL